ncbi:MAG TPA: hypothetical protein VMS79_00755 [Methanomassiliicoccales archaeon]|nr:hypothetical protein [Methanomassiliicoccales archaeon]
MAASPQRSTRMCMGCGRVIPAEYNVCPFCGAPQNVRYGQPQMPPVEPLGSGMTILLYVLSFLIPIVGLIAGIVLWATGPDESRKHVGMICILISIVGWVLTILLSWILYVLVMGFH